MDYLIFICSFGYFVLGSFWAHYKLKGENEDWEKIFKIVWLWPFYLNK